MNDVTALLDAVPAGDPAAAAPLPLLHDDVRRRAAHGLGVQILARRP